MDLSPYLPLLDPSTAQALVGVLLVVAMLHVILGGCAYGVMLERKLSSWMQDRVGPNRVGPRGLFQPLADGLKFMMKEDYNPAGVDRALFILAPAFIVVPAFIGFVIMPWGGEVDITAIVQFFGLAQPNATYPVRLIAADINVGVVYLLATGGLGVYGVALGGWASNSKWSFLGGLRAGAQMISYEIPMGLTLLCVVLAVGSFNPYDIVGAQLAGQWNIVQQPLAAIIFYTCLLAEANRAPFDLAEAESELVGGYHTEYSSMKFALYFLGEYFHLITGSAFFTIKVLRKDLRRLRLAVRSNAARCVAASCCCDGQDHLHGVLCDGDSLDDPALPLRSTHAPFMGRAHSCVAHSSAHGRIRRLLRRAQLPVGWFDSLRRPHLYVQLDHAFEQRIQSPHQDDR